MSAVSLNRMLPPVHSYGAGPSPAAAELMRVAHVEKTQKVQIPGVQLLEIGSAFPGPAALLRGTHVENLQKVQVPGVHLMFLGGAFPGPESLIAATQVKKQQAVEIPGARPPDVAGAYPGPAALMNGTDPPIPHEIEVPGVRMGVKQPDSYLSLMARLANLHISITPAPPGRETAPPSPRQAAIDAYTGR